MLRTKGSEMANCQEEDTMTATITVQLLYYDHAEASNIFSITNVWFKPYDSFISLFCIVNAAITNCSSESL